MVGKHKNQFVLGARVFLVAVLGMAVSACQNSMPIGVGPFPKHLEVIEGQFKLCDLESTANCEDVTDYERLNRNMLQHALLTVATAECHDFKMKLYGWTRAGIFSSAISHISSAAATITGHDVASRALSGISSASGGIGSDIDGYFRQSRLSIALNGIELERTRIFKQINEKRETSVEEYPVPRAVNDVLRYHQVCNLPDGLSASGDAVEDATESAAQK